MSKGYSSRRERLYKRFFTEYRAQNINYRKYYLASEGARKLGWWFSNFSTVGGAGLLLILGGILTGEVDQQANLWAFILSAVISASSYINSSANFYERSNVYYNAGQIHHNLFSEMDKMVKMRIPDKTENICELEEECEDLIKRKNELNESTPQLPDKWYIKLKIKRNLSWEPGNLRDIENGVYDFSATSGNESERFRRIRYYFPIIDRLINL